jgi:Spy/CpxP family protein refolding chaperone
MSGERTKTAAVGLVLAVFVLGAALGALGMYWAGRSVMAGPTRRTGPSTPAEHNARVVDSMKKDLGLTAEQQKQLLAILDQTGAKYKSVHEQVAPQMDAIRKEGRDQIRGILSPEQLPKFEEKLHQMDEDRKKRTGGN